MKIRVTTSFVSLLPVFGRNVFFIHSNDGLLKILIVIDALKHVANVVSEHTFKSVLLINFFPQSLALFSEAVHLELHVSYDKFKICLDPGEVFDLLIHLGGLLFQDADGLCVWLNVLLKLLDLVVQNKFKLLKLLSFQT